MHLPESDWKYLRDLHEILVEELSHRRNDELRGVLANVDLTENAKRREIYGLVEERDKIVADCFNAWARSNIIEKARLMRFHGLLPDEHLSHLTPETRASIEVAKPNAGPLKKSTR